MSSRGRRRSSTGVTDFLQDIVDNIKDFVDDEIVDRGRDSERDLRRSGRRWADDDEDRGGSSRDSDIEELRDAVQQLNRQVAARLKEKRAAANGQDADALPFSDYDDLNADEIVSRLGSVSQKDLKTVAAYERRHSGRTTVLDRIEALQGDEPWPGYDEQTVAEIRKELPTHGDDTAREVRDYERRHKGRQGVLDAAAAALSS